MRTCAYVTNVTCSVHDPLWIDHVCVCVCVYRRRARILFACARSVGGVYRLRTGCLQVVGPRTSIVLRWLL